MSIMGKKWLLINNNPSLSVWDKLLENRQHLRLFERIEYHPHSDFPQMDLAIARIITAMDKGERVMIFGDYDVDGITASAILLKTLKELGIKVSCRLPKRGEDNYGLSEKFVREFADLQVKLLITVDCGISCLQEIRLAKELGIDTIVSDHHTVPKKLPEAIAIVHPLLGSYPNPHLTGAGVALKIAQALAEKFPLLGDLLLELSVLATLGTVADLGKLVGENRALVQEGLRNLSEKKSLTLPGLRRLLNQQTVINTKEIGFRIAPLLNASGRIGDPYLPLKLLLREKDSPDLEKLVTELEAVNRRRKELTDSIFREILKELQEKTEYEHIAVGVKADWPIGVLGLVAGRLVEKFNRPALVIQELADSFTGSARSPEYCNITEILTKNASFLSAFGGHHQAAGFSLSKENLRDFLACVEKDCGDLRKNLNDTRGELKIDCAVALEDLNDELWEKLLLLEPFGVGNETPLFLLKGITPLQIINFGADNSHLKIILADGLEAIAFGWGKEIESLATKKTLDLVFRLEENLWRDRRNLRLAIVDLA